MGDRVHHRPEELSGGQQQRVAIARALVNNRSSSWPTSRPARSIPKTGQELLALFDELHTQGITLIVVTHDMGVASRADRIITLRDGEIVEDRRNGHRPARRAGPVAGLPFGIHPAAPGELIHEAA